MTTTSDREVPAPLPCPFCGKVPSLSREHPDDDPKRPYLAGCRTLDCTIGGQWYALSDWNRRVSPSVAPPAPMGVSERAAHLRGMIRRRMKCEVEKITEREGREDRGCNCDDVLNDYAAACSAPSGETEPDNARDAMVMALTSLRVAYGNGTFLHAGIPREVRHDLLAVFAYHDQFGVPSRLSEEVQKADVKQGAAAVVAAINANPEPRKAR